MTDPFSTYILRGEINADVRRFGMGHEEVIGRKVGTNNIFIL